MATKARNFMSKAAHLFENRPMKIGQKHRGSKQILIGAVAVLLFFPASARAGESAEYKKNETGLYRDVFDQNMYYEGTQYLHLERLYRDLFHKRIRSANVNPFDEVPDSTFFTNRHARKRLSESELERGPHQTDGLDLSGPLTVIRGKFEGLHPGFFVRDAHGDEYLLKFDPVDNLELSTSAEIVASRFYHAIGYNVPQYTIDLIEPEKFVPAPDATIYDDTGFKKKLTAERLAEYLLFIPQDSQGRYRASVSKILPGENKGYFSFHGRRKEDPDDPVPHRERREIRALQVFSSWLNNYDVRESNTLDMLVEENGPVLKHYLIDFNTAFGSGTVEGKPPMVTYEHMFDYGETLKAFLTLGWWEKPWQRRWREAGEKITASPAVGYFDNRYFDPGKYKIQLPHYAFKDITRADGFWAAKIIMTFSDDDIRAMVKAGEYTDPKDAETLAKILMERRDIIGRYWFEKTNPLDEFDVSDNRLVFKDLAVEYDFAPKEGNLYRIDVIAKNGKRGKKIATHEVQTPSVNLEDWLAQNEGVDLLIRTLRPGSSKPGPYVLVELSRQGVAGIHHED